MLLTNNSCSAHSVILSVAEVRTAFSITKGIEFTSLGTWLTLRVCEVSELPYIFLESFGIGGYFSDVAPARNLRGEIPDIN
jgi:hypothetical protein